MMVWKNVKLLELFYQQKSGNKKEIRFYRDEGLLAFRNKSSTQLERIKKKLQRLLKKDDPKITTESNQKIANYLHVTLNLKDDTFKPYYKSDNKIQYIRIEFNHPPNLIKLSLKPIL